VKKKIAQILSLLLVLSSVIVYSPAALKVDAVSAATTGEETPAAPTKPSTPKPATTKPTTAPKDTVVVTGDQIYVVVKGDNLSSIAKKHNITLAQLLQLNPQIKNARLIFTGQKIVVGKASTAAAAVKSDVKVYQGLGHSVIFRNGPGKDSKDVPVYSFTVVFADATFDAQGKIINTYFDAYEVATPNYDGESMPHFTGWPGQGYNETDHKTAEVSGVKTNTLETATAEVNGWKTKRERGDSYEMNPKNEWYNQMNFYQKFFVGKTVSEIKDWFAKYGTSATRPIKSTTTNVDDLKKLAGMTDTEKAELADVVSGATMSVSDAHGDFLGALQNAFDNRVEVTVPVK
jgi:LysM repeat protein